MKSTTTNLLALYSELFRGFCLLFTAIVLSKALMEGSLSITLGLAEFIIPFLAAILLLILKKSGIIQSKTA